MQVAFAAAARAARRSRGSSLAVALLCVSFGMPAALIFHPPDPPMNSELLMHAAGRPSEAPYAALAGAVGVAVGRIDQGEIESSAALRLLRAERAPDRLQQSYMDLLGVAPEPYAHLEPGVPADDWRIRYLGPTFYHLHTTPEVLVQILAPASAMRGCGERIQLLQTWTDSIGQMLGSLELHWPILTGLATCRD